MLTSELSILALYGLLVMATVLVQVLLAVPQLGLPYLSSPRDAGKALTGTAARSERCLNNSVIAMALFAPAVLLLHVTGGFTANTLLAAQVFLIARAAYLVIYLAGIPWARTLIWLAGFFATAFLYVSAL